MIEPKCRLTVADRFYGGGSVTGNPNISVPTLSQLQPQIQKGYNFQLKQFPTLGAAEQNALSYSTGLNAGMPNIWNPSASELRAVDQSTLAKEAAAGTAHTSGSIGRQVLAEDQYKLQRAGQIQGLQTGGLNQLLGVSQGKLAALNPILGAVQYLTGLQTQADISGAQIGAQGDIAGKQSQSDLIGGALSAVGSVAGAAAMSDERLKTKIRETGLKSKEGIPLKIYEFKTRPGIKFFGPMAQDVEKARPDAVITDPVSGVKMVDFWKLKAPMIELNPMGATT